MAYKLINAHEVKEGTSIIVDGAPCTARGNDISKTGKHGASKCRIECIGVLDGKKRIVAVPGHERFEVPLIEKKKAQILSVSGETASVMDSESFETFDIPISEEVKADVAEGKNAEYWEVDGVKVLKRIMQ
jgi:translation initiation factor 5A